MTAQSENTTCRRRDKGEVWLEAAFIIGCIVTQVAGWTRYFGGTVDGMVLGGGLIAGWLLADLLSGVAHFLADNFGSQTTPVFGKAVIATFREHHESPSLMLGHGFFERNGWNCAGAAMLSLPVLLCRDPSVFGWAPALLSTGFCVAWTNQIHAWAHSESRPQWVTALQRWGLILSPSQHARHHRPFDQAGAHPSGAQSVRGPRAAPPWSEHYCITSGFWDRVVAVMLGTRHQQAPFNPPAYGRPRRSGEK